MDMQLLFYLRKLVQIRNTNRRICPNQQQQMKGIRNRCSIKMLYQQQALVVCICIVVIVVEVQACVSVKGEGRCLKLSIS